MPTNVTATTMPLKGVNSTDRGPAQVLRECMAAHHVRIADVAAIWGVSESVAQRIVNGERPIQWGRLRSLPAPVLSDWCRRWGASIEGRPTRGLAGELLDLPVSLGRVCDEARAALADGVVTEEEKLRLRDELARLLADIDDVAAEVG